MRMLSVSGEESTEELIETVGREQLRRVHESQEEYKALAETYYADMVACQEDSQALQKQMTAMTEMLNRQRREIARLNGKAEQPPVDLGYEQMAKWWNNIIRTALPASAGSPCPEICRLSKPIYGLPLSDPSGGGLLRLPDGTDQSRHLFTALR